MSEQFEDYDSVPNTSYDEKLKLMVIGETRVGKTSLIKKYTKDVFGGTYLTTIGIDFQEKMIQIDGKSIKLQIWDTAGEERFRNIAKNYFNTSDGFLLVYDITCKDSLEKLDYWYGVIKENAPENTKCIVVGNKADLEEQREVNTIDGTNFSKKYNINFFETSAKEGTNVYEVFEKLSSEIMKDINQKGRKNKEASQVLKKSKKSSKTKCCQG
jgi:small GTP-binding protein